ncbi:MAG: hypothetical protein ABSH22_21990 [Tepidisphaeraceae bacterium]
MSRRRDCRPARLTTLLAEGPLLDEPDEGIAALAAKLATRLDSAAERADAEAAERLEALASAWRAAKRFLPLLITLDSSKGTRNE